MPDQFNLYDIYEQNLNFLFGAGASCGFLPTLSLELKGNDGETYTFETLAKELSKTREHEHLYTLLFMYYYESCIRPGLPNGLSLTQDEQSVLTQYELFLQTLLAVLNKQGRNEKKCNIYTTNYDNCLEVASDALIVKDAASCVINDGSAGFQTRTFHTKNFNNRVVQKGIFDKHAVCVPQINILHPHGSVYWRKVKQSIDVSYGDSCYKINFNDEQVRLISEFEKIVRDKTKSLPDLFEFGEDELEDWDALKPTEFWTEYNEIPIVNPTKWKFHETVFEEAYYQILRQLSFELERPNSALITFGFSFADEHILHLVQRSLSNPSLTVYISCFNEAEKIEMQDKFKGYSNVKYIALDENLTFARFNKYVFNLRKDSK